MRNEEINEIIMPNDEIEVSKPKGVAKKSAKELERISILIAAAAVIISAISSYVTIQLTQKHNKQSVMPLLSAWRAESESSNSISWNAYNAGLGPAKIKIAKAFIKNEEYLGSLGSFDFKEKLQLNANMIVDVKWNSIIVQDDIIKDGDDAEMVTIKWINGTVPNDYDADFNLVLAYCYCSVYGECLYEDTRSGGNNTPLLNCPND
ncbi:hypothetical protein [Pseudoalteromonas xiamenensis]